MELFLAGIAAGGIISWIITYAYYKKGSKDLKIELAQLKELVSKLPQVVIDGLKHDSRQKLTVAELNTLIDAQTRPEHPQGPLDVIACPKCGSPSLDTTPGVIEDWESNEDGEPSFCGTGFEQVRCRDCGWNDSELKHMDLP